MLGLSAGLACTIVILLYVQSETSYDQYHTDKDRIYRLGSDFQIAENSSQVALSSVHLAPMLQSYFPGIQSTLRLHRIPKIKASYDGADRKIILGGFHRLPLFHRRIHLRTSRFLPAHKQ